MAIVGLGLEGFEKFADKIEPAKFRSRLRREIKKATAKNGLIAEGAVKENINKGNFAANQPLTTALKGSSRPLVDSGDLVKAITNRPFTFQVVIGVLRKVAKRNKLTGKIDNIQDIAAILHNGITISVTPKMRRLFFALADENPKIKPLNPKTKVIVIPARPFMEAAVAPTMLKIYQLNWEEAVQRALKGIEK